MLMVGLVALFSVGCGDSRDNFVSTTNQGNTGNLVFNFQQATPQTVTTVPANTTQLRFDLFSTNPGTLATLVETRGPIAYANQVVLQNVPSNVVFVAVTALSADGIPLSVSTGAASVIIGDDNTVNLTNVENVTFDSLTVTPNPINLDEGGTQTVTVTANFSNDESATLSNENVTFNVASGEIANISSSGVLTALNAGNTTLDASWTFGSTTRMDTALVNVFSFVVNGFDSFYDIPQTGTEPDDVDFNGTFVGPSGTAVSIFQDDVNVSFALQSPVTGVSIDGFNVVVDSTASPGTAVIVATYTDPVTSRVMTVNFTVTIDFPNA